MAMHEFMIDLKIRGGPEGTLPSGVVAEFRDGRITQTRWYLDKLEAAKSLAKGMDRRTVASVAKRVEAMVNP
jgi:hypothetical protein